MRKLLILNKLIKKSVLMSMIIGSVALIGCGTQTNEEKVKSENQIVVEHKLGTTKLNDTSKKVAVLELSFLDSLYNLGVNTVAIADDGEQTKVTDITTGESIEYVSVGNRKEPNLEELSTLDLDLIIADTTRHSKIYEDLSKIAPTIVLDSIGSSYDEYIKNFETIAKIVGKEDKAKTKKILTVSPKNDEYTAHTSTSFVGQVLEKAGFVNAIENNDKEVSLSLEQLVEINPDIMVYMREDIDKTIYKEWKDTELYKSLKAIQNGDVYTTIARGPWTQYRGFISINTLTKEMSQWLLDNN